MMTTFAGTTRRLTLGSILVVGTATACCGADSTAIAARAILRQWQDAVIAVRLITKQRMVMSGREMDRGEHAAEGNGVVIDSTGLTVVSLSDADPYGSISSAADQYGGDGDFRYETEITDARMLMTDGAEIAAKTVLRDRDLDLVFIRPSATTKRRFHGVTCSGGARLDVLDQVVLLSRKGREAGRAPAVSLVRLQAVVEKPRLYYIPEMTAMFEGLCRPVFRLNGGMVGILLLRRSPYRSEETNEVPMILPCEEILEAVRQVGGR